MKSMGWITAIGLAAALGTGAYIAIVRPPWSADAPAGCAEHGVEACPFCSPERIDALGICPEHRVPEALCVRCRPDLEPAFRAEGDWCGGHGVPESQCELCNPGVLDRYAVDAPDPPPRAAPVTVVRSDVPRVRRPPEVTCATESSVVRLAAAHVAESAGLEYAQVERVPLRQSVEATAQLAYDARRYARLAPRAPGIVVEIRTDLGEAAEAGDVLVVLESPDIGAAKSALLQAEARVHLWEQGSAREERLLEKSLTTEREALQAETQLVEARIAARAAQQRLAALGLDPQAIDRVVAEGDVSLRLPVTAPFGGVVVELGAVIGELAGVDVPLVGLADTSRMWALLDVDPHEVGLVGIGAPVLLQVDGLEGRTLAGRVSWVSRQVDARTRTVRVRAELDNPEGRLRAGAFATARIVVHDGEEAVVVPKAAVQWEGCCNVAFVRRSETEFVPRKLQLGSDTGLGYEVLSGLEGGELVVTEGSFLLGTELQKGSIGAGCCEVDHLGG